MSDLLIRVVGGAAQSLAIGRDASLVREGRLPCCSDGRRILIRKTRLEALRSGRSLREVIREFAR